MGLTITDRTWAERPMKHVHRIEGVFDADDSYPAGGYDVTFIHPRIADMHVVGGGYIWQFDRTTKKIKAMKIDTGLLVEETAATDLQAQTDLQFVAYINPWE